MFNFKTGGLFFSLLVRLVETAHQLPLRSEGKRRQRQEEAAEETMMMMLMMLRTMMMGSVRRLRRAACG